MQRKWVVLALCLIPFYACTSAKDAPQPKVAPSPTTVYGVEIRLSEREVDPREVVQLEIHFPSKDSHTWGLESRVEQHTKGKWKSLYYVLTDPSADRPAPYYRAGQKNTDIPLIGFTSDKSPVGLEIRIPPLEPGSYRFCKDFSINQTADGNYQSETACDLFQIRKRSADHDASSVTAVCRDSQFDLGKEPNYPVNYIHRWGTKDGCKVRLDILMTRQGEDACGGSQVADILMGTPLGRSPQASTARIYVKDPEDVFHDAKTSSLYDRDAELPDEAVDTGYRQEGAELWMVPDDDGLIYLVRANTVEAWPRDETPPGCG